MKDKRVYRQSLIPLAVCPSELSTQSNPYPPCPARYSACTRPHPRTCLSTLALPIYSEVIDTEYVPALVLLMLSAERYCVALLQASPTHLELLVFWGAPTQIHSRFLSPELLLQSQDRLSIRIWGSVSTVREVIVTG